jgi:hypothetical protein
MTINVKKINIKRPITLQALVIIVIVLLLFSISQAPGNSAQFNYKDSNSVSRQKQRREELKKKISSGAAGNFQRSLEMKENVDFLLTPALLVQEVISKDIVITYPSE